MSIRRRGTQKKRLLSHRFEMPQGTDAFEYADDFHWGTDDDDDSDGDDEEYGEDTTTPATKKKDKPKKKKKKKKKKGKAKGNDNRLKSPKGFKVVQQTIRTLRDGSQLVDLVVEVDKIGRADKYEFRIVKKDNGSVKIVNAS